jgi:CHAT domain-containing protein/Flp pilus assembly protein TadD
MFRKVIWILIFVISFTVQSQNIIDDFIKTKEEYKKQNNLEEFYYHYIDYFVEKKNELQPDFFELAIKEQWRKPSNTKELIAKLHLLVNYAYYLKKNGRIKDSIIIYEKALKLYQNNNINDYSIISYCLKPLANNYTRIGDYKRAEELFKYTISLAKKHGNLDEVIASYLNLSIKYQSIGKINRAIFLINQAIELKPKTEQLALLYSQLAKYKLILGETKLAHQIVLKSILKDKKSKFLTTNNATLARVYEEQKKYNKALSLLHQNLKILDSKRQKAKTLIDISSIFLKEKKHKKALIYLNKSLSILIPSFTPKSIFDLPSHNFYYPENSIKEALDAKANIFERMQKYKYAIKHYNESFIVEEYLRKSLVSQKSKLLLQAESRIRSEKMINLYDLIYQKEPTDSLIIEMLKIMDLSKSTVLSDEIGKENSYKLIKNDSLYNKYNTYQKQIAFLDSQIQKESLKGNPDVIYLEELNQKKSKLTTSYVVLENKIQRKYPFLTKLNFDNDFKKTINSIINVDKHIFYFFNTQKYLYIVSITDKKITYNRVIKTLNFKNKLQRFVLFFSSGNPEIIDNNISDFREVAFDLCTIFFGGNLSEKENFTIIPDQQLNFIPFDALLTKKTESSNYAKFPFLVLEKNINYGYSLTMLKQLKEQKEIDELQSMIGFFPVFENNFRKKEVLKFTKNEMEKIKKYYNGSFYVKDKATKINFLTKSSNFDIIHISTHADAGDYYNPAKIEFYDATLSLLEIYGLQFNSNLIVLSACETGVGKLKNGEGVISLSRGFSYAGIPNLIVSQWKVNDKSTSILMGDFYKNLKKTNSINKSLQQAKKDYLFSKSVDVYKKNPYYWSGFIHVGITTKMVRFSSFLYYTLILAFFVFLFFILFKIKKRINFAIK